MTRIVGRLFAYVFAVLAAAAHCAFAESWSSIPAPPALSFHAATWDSIGRRLIAFDGTAVHVLPDGARVWSRVTPEGVGPASLREFAWGSDSAGRRLFVFGGLGAQSALRDETWVLHTGMPLRWERLADTTAKPPARRAASLLHDPVADRLVLYGGKSTTELADVWMLPLDGTSGWSRMPDSTNTAGPRSGHMAVYDPGDRRMLVFGGSGNPTTISRLYSDVWALDLGAAAAWTRLVPSGGIPLGRAHAQAVLDAARDRLLVFGGTTEQGETNDAVSLSLAPDLAWQAPLPPIPGVKSAGRAIAFDARADQVLLSGGAAAATHLNVLTLTPTPSWVQSGDWFDPPAETRWSVHAFYDSTRDQLTYLDAGWEASFATVPPTWTRTSFAGSRPGPTASFVHDPLRDRIIIVTEGLNDEVFFLDLSTRSWSSAPATGVPYVPKAGRLALDPRRDRLLLANTNTSTGTPIYLPTDLWELSLTPPLTWNRLQEPSLPYVWAAGLGADTHFLHDPLGDRLIMDGITGTPDICYCLNQPRTRSLDFPTLEWTELATVVLPRRQDGSPNVRFGSKWVLDPVGGRVVLGDANVLSSSAGPVTFGGWVSGLTPALSWRELPRVGAPRVEGTSDDLGVAFDSRRNRLLVLGMGDLWSFEFDPWPASPGLVCPAARTWTPGAIDTLRYAVSNPRDVPATVEVRGTSERAWDSFPRTWLESFAAGETREIDLPVLVPDSVSAGSNRVAVTMRWLDQPGIAASCRTRLGDGPPQPIVLIETEVAPGFVRLVWLVPEMPDGEIRVERGTSPSDWYAIGVAVKTAADRLMFEDHPLGSSGRLYYRMSWQENGTVQTSPPAAVDLPNPTLAVLECPSDRPWTPGVLDQLVYRIANPRSVPATLAIQWTSRRTWEPFPVVQLESLAVGESREIVLPLLTPDSVAVGANRITASVRWLDETAVTASCSVRLGDGSPPPTITLLEAVATPDRVRFLWSAPEMPDGDVVVERSASGSVWTRAGLAVATSVDRLSFEDHPDGRVGRWFYRWSWLGPEGDETSEIVTVDLPGATLSVRTRVPLQAGSLVRVAYTLPAPGEATLELVGISGRRVGLQRIGAGELRTGEIDFRMDRSILPGVYVLRLSHAGAGASSKVVVVP